MHIRIIFGLTTIEMDISPTVLAWILISSIAFIVGFAKSSRENEYKN